MSTKHYVPKYIQVREYIREQIVKGVYDEGAKIPPERELSDLFNVSRITIVNAIKDLVNDQLLVRKGPLGTYVASISSKNTEKNMTALFLRASGDVFGEIASTLIGKLQFTGHYTSLFDTNTIYFNPDEGRKQVKEFLERSFDLMIIEGYEWFSFDLLDDDVRRNKDLVFILNMETALPFTNAIKVLSDFEEGGYQITKHLLEKGHRRIMSYTHEFSNVPFLSANQFYQGGIRACKESGVDPDTCYKKCIYTADQTKNPALLKSLLKDKNRPTAISCFFDYRVKEVIEAAQNIGLKIPDDLAVTGYFDTPWCYKLDVPITSVNVNISKMVSEAVDAISTLPKGKGYETYIKPKLIVRDSS